MISMSEWKLVGVLNKRGMQSVKDPIGKLHGHLMAANPKATSIMAFGMGAAGQAYFKEQITKACKKKFSHLSGRKLASSIALTLLDAAPCDVEGAEGFEIFTRELL